MMRTLITRLLAFIILLVVGIIAVASMRPDDFRVTRTATVPAPAETVFANVNELRRWDLWSPWAKLDPNAKNTFDGPAAGAGASLSWSGNHEIGEGRMTITESRPNEFVQYRLEFVRPFEGVSTAEFSIQAKSEGETTVTWSMFGKNNLIAKVVGLFMDCDKMVGDQFETGLKQLGQVSAAQ